MSITKRSGVVLIISVSLVLLTSMMDFPTQTIAAIGSSLVIQDELQPVDVIHVIAGEDYRSQYAIDLYKQGYAKVLFFTGGWCIQHGYYHGAHALQLALEAGVPREAVAYDDSQVSSTYEEALLLAKYLSENFPGDRSVMVVSDPFHMRRAQWTYRQIFGTRLTVLLAPVPFVLTPFKEQWWTDSTSARYVKDEYEKLAFYFFRYKLNLKWLAGFDKY